MRQFTVLVTFFKSTHNSKLVEFKVQVVLSTNRKQSIAYQTQSNLEL